MVTVEDVPQQIELGDLVNITFVIRRHESMKVTNMDANLVFIHLETGQRVLVQALVDIPNQKYISEYEFLQSGSWAWKIVIVGMDFPMPDLYVEDVEENKTPAEVGGYLAGLILIGLLVGGGYPRINSPRGKNILVILGVLGAGALLISGYGGRLNSKGLEGREIARLDYGQSLFITKGCVTCHEHDGVAYTGELRLRVAPDLTKFQADEGYLASWLDSPVSINPNAEMPDLDMTAAEIDVLVTFLNEK